MARVRVLNYDLVERDILISPSAAGKNPDADVNGTRHQDKELQSFHITGCNINKFGATKL